MKNRIYTKLSFIGIILIMLLWAGIDIYPHKNGNGVTGLTATSSGGCSCHSSTPSSATTLSVSSSSGSFTFAPEANVNFTVAVMNSGEQYAGTNIAIKTTLTGDANIGTLSVETGSGLKLQNSEITHNDRKAMSSGKAEFTFGWKSPTEPGKYYLRAIGNAVNGDGFATSADQHNWLTPQEVIVTGILVSAPTSSSSCCTGSNQIITWGAFGPTNVKIELSNDGGSSYNTVLVSSISASTGSYSWNVPTDFPSGSQYKIKVSYESNGTIKGESQLFSINSPPSITQQPQGSTVCEGSTINLSVTTTGNVTSYQWKKNGTPVNNSNASTLTINNAKGSDAGSYTVLLSSSCGSPVESQAGVVAVNESAGISLQPLSTELCLGEDLNLIIKTKGKNKIVKWFKEDNEIPNSLNKDTLTILNVDEGDAGKYYAKVEADCGILVSSNFANLIIKSPALVTVQPKSQTVCEGSTISISVTATGSGLTYTWQNNGTNIPNSNVANLVIDNATKDKAGNYKVIVQGSCGNAETSLEVSIVINSKPVITLNPVSQNLKIGAKLELKVASTDATSYQWKRNGYNINNATNATYTVNSVTTGDMGNYVCTAVNSCGETNSAEAVVYVEGDGNGPIIQLSQYEYDFGVTEIGTTKKFTLENFIKNIGNQTLTIDYITVSGQNRTEFLIDEAIPFNLEPNTSKSITVQMIPTSGGDKKAIVKVFGNVSAASELNLKGFAADLKVDLDVPAVNFDPTQIGKSNESDFILTNTSNLTITVLSTALLGDNPSVFEILEPNGSFDLPINQGKLFKVKFNPTVTGEYNAKLSIGIKYFAEPKVIDLKGNAVISSVNDVGLFVDNINIFPNPSENAINFKISVLQSMNYKLKIYSENAGLIKTFDGNFNASGYYNLNWNGLTENGDKIINGTYFAVLEFNGMSKVVKFVIAR
jgi:hypothetical protein